jgi:hypothetical protein
LNCILLFGLDVTIAGLSSIVSVMVSGLLQNRAVTTMSMDRAAA